MAKSMTGYGRGEFSDGKRSAVIEIKSVNHRYCEVTVRIARRYAFAEEHLKSIVKASVKRGKADLSVTIDNITEGDVKIKLNMAAAEQYHANLRELQDRFGLSGGIDLHALAAMPDVMRQAPDIDDEAELLRLLEQALRPALEGFDAMRRAEGAKLSADILARGQLIEGWASEMEQFAPDIVLAYAEKLRERIRELIGQEAELPEERIAIEAAIFADRINITEELVRLKSHISQLRTFMQEKSGANGKKLDFLAQELNREANTIASKANDIRVTNFALEIKSEVEKIREQIQNIE
ncbi:MAG: YicC family protein [Clostridiales Family XIII bacterium]|jgi:uncharacterized protein (TIGR00255 family)|nr:YicC family protein [Clostridiales Family XIII bacterium]